MHGMADRKAHAARFGRACGSTSRWLLRAASLAGAAFSALAFLLLAIFGQSGWSLRLLEPAIVSGIEARTGGEVSIGDIAVLPDRNSAAPFELLVTDIVIDRGEESNLQIPSVSIRMDMQSLLEGSFFPEFIEVEGIHLSVEGTASGLSLGGRMGGAGPLDIADLLTRARAAGFEGAMLRDVDLTYRNTESQTVFEVQDGNAVLRQDGEAYSFVLNVPSGREGGGDVLRLDVTTDLAADTVEALITAIAAPAGAILPIFTGDDPQIDLDAPMSGTLAAHGSLSRGIKNLDVDMEVGEGTLTVRDAALKIVSIQTKSVFEPSTGQMDVAELSYDIAGNQGTVAGLVAFVQKQGALIGLDFAINAQALVMEPAGLLAAPLPIDDARLEGYYDLVGRDLVLETLDADYFGARVAGTLSFALPLTEGESPGLTADLRVQGDLSPEQVLRGWPVLAAPDARDWVERNLPQAELYNVRYNMDLPRGALTAGEALAAERIDLTFDARNATIIYVPGMTPIEGLSGQGRIQGNSFHLDAQGGRVGPVSVIDGAIEMDQFVPKGAPAIFKAQFAGELLDILTILNEQPLGYLTKAGLEPSQFSGEGRFSLEVSRPLLSFVPLEDYGFSGKGTFGKLTIDGIGPNLRATEGVGDVILTSDDLTIAGTLVVEGVPADVTWRRGFDESEPVYLRARARLDPWAADAVGLPIRRFFNGFVDTTVTATGNKDLFNRIEIAADLAEARLAITPGTPVKEIGEDGEARVVITRESAESPILAETMQLSTSSANVEGGARFSSEGGLLELDLPRLYIEGVSDLSVRLSRAAEDFGLTVSGTYLNAVPILEQLTNQPSTPDPEAQPTNEGGVVNIDASLERIELRNGLSLESLEARGQLDARGLRQLDAAAALDETGMVGITVMDNPAGLGRDIHIATDRFGQLVTGLSGVTSVTGGEAFLKATALRQGPMVGHFEAADIEIQNAPLVAKLLSIGSLDGFANAVNGEGLAFTDFKGDLQLGDGELRLVDVRLTGSSLGISANGSLALNGSDIDLFGAVAPVYGVNSFFGNLPGLGDLFVSRKGEGLVAFAYGIDGPAAGPTISVNTLTALTPGIFRRIFEPIGLDRPSSDELLSQAQTQAGTDEAMEFLSTPELLQEYEAAQQADAAQP